MTTEARVSTAPRVVYQGEPGAFGEMAIIQQWGGLAAAVGATSFPDTLSLLGRGCVKFTGPVSAGGRNGH